MQKFLRFLALVALTAVPWAVNAQNTLTVADGTVTNVYVPVYGYYGDAYLHCQYIYPASDIALATTTVGMNGGSITSMTFYTTEASVSLSATFTFKLMEVSYTTLDAYQDVTGATLVYTGSVAVANNQMTVTFDNPYTYNGGNLLVDLTTVSTGNYSQTTYYGVSASGASVSGYSYSSVSAASIAQRNFIPKTTFTFTGGTAVTCPPIQGITLGAIDSNSAVITWVDSLNSGANYTVTYWADGDATNILTETSSGDSATLTGLNANTVYHYTVQVNCSASDNSVALGGTFRTACGTMSLPLFVDFEDAAHNGAWYPCWDSTIHAGTDPSVNDQPGGSYNPTQHTPGGTYAMYLQGNSNENYNLVVGPTMDVSGDNIYCRFWAFVNNGWIKAGVISNPHDTSTFIPLVQVNGSSWAEYEFNTANISSTENYRVAWLAYGTGYIGKFDDVYISEIPSCLRVSSVAIDSVSDESITLSWVDTLNSGATYTVTCYGPNDTVEQSNITDLFYVFDNLNANTPYTFSVVVNCGSGDAEAVTVSGRTACAAMQIPFTEGFEDAGALSCWKMVDCASNTGRTTGNANTGNACFRFYYGYNNQYLISPELTGTDNGVKVQFAYKQGTSYTETFKVGYSTTNDSVSSFVWGDEMTATSSYQTFSAIYPAGTKYVSIQLTSYDQLYLYIDDINFIEPPACMPVSLMGVDTVTADEATIYWTAPDGQSDFFVLLDSTVYTTSDTFYTFTGLDARTAYTAYVASDCSGDTSEWRNISFTTDCAGGSCDIVIAAQDSYGDGWNGAQLNFTQNGTVVGSYSMPGQGLYSTPIYDTAMVSVCSGTPVSFSWQTGSYDSEITYTIYDGGGAEVYSSTTSGVNHSDIILDPCPTCMAPAGVMLSAVDSNELTFVWTEDINVDHYIVSFNGGGYTMPNNGNASHMVTGLTPNTAYTFSVIAICEVNVDSSVARTITVKTACGEMVLPVVESFESDNDGSVPSCWNVVSGSPAVMTGNYYAHTGTNSLAFESGDMIATSQVPLDGDSIYVSFWTDIYSGTLQAGVMTNPLYDSTFTPLLTVTGTNGYEMFEFNTDLMDHYTNYYVAFRFNGSYYGINVDDINIRKNEGCMYPANLTATPAAHEVDLTWVNTSSNSDFVVQYRAVTATAWDTTIDVFDTTYTVTNLNAATSYVFRVGYLCNNDTLWSTINAQTTCDLISLPYFENFDAYANDVLPPCWDYDQAGVTHWDGGLFFRSNSSGGTGAYAVVPQLAGNFTKLKIEFDTKVGTIAEQDGILLGAADATGTLVGWLDTIQDVNHSRNGFVHHIITMVGYNIPAGAERVVFAQYRSWGEWALIDNISIEQLPDCYPVDSLEAHNLIDPDHTNFTWQSLGNESEWQVYVDTATIDINTVPDSLLTTVYSRYYEIPMGTIQGGGIYTFYVRANCGQDQSTWTSYTFGAGTYVMNNSATADTVVACGLVVYDNGGPIAGYLPNSNSALVIRSENVGSQLEVFGGAFGFGSDAATLTIYDGEGTTGAVLYTYNTIDGRDTLDTVLATSTTGALTITFVSSGQMCHTGYELYIHCVGTALCERPTQLSGVMTGNGQATVTWMGSANSYDLYYKPVDAAAWTIQSGINGTTTNLTNLLPDTTYTLQVVGICGNDTSTPSFPAVLNTHFDVLPCDPVTGLTVGNVTTTTATLSWNSTADTWEIELSNVSGSTTITTTSNPHTLINLLPNMGYSARVRALCGAGFEPSSQWSAPVTFTTDTVPSQGIEGVDSYNSFVLYPNPATTTVAIDLTGVEDAALVSIIDLNGRKVYSEQVIDERMTVDVSALAKGAYFVRVTGSNTTAVRKLIVK